MSRRLIFCLSLFVNETDFDGWFENLDKAKDTPNTQRCSLSCELWPSNVAIVLQRHNKIYRMISPQSTRTRQYSAAATRQTSSEPHLLTPTWSFARSSIVIHTRWTWMMAAAITLIGSLITSPRVQCSTLPPYAGCWHWMVNPFERTSPSSSSISLILSCTVIWTAQILALQYLFYKKHPFAQQHHHPSIYPYVHVCYQRNPRTTAGTTVLQWGLWRRNAHNGKERDRS